MHTSCSLPIFGVDFGVFRPISGCVASKNDKSDCVVISEKKDGTASFRAANEVDITTDDTTRVFVLIIESGLLPIEFTHIRGMAQGANNLILWGIESVVGEDRMILQKSNDGHSYTDLKSYNELRPSDFEFIDENVGSLRSYYRFKIISTEGKETLSTAIAITNENGSKGTVNIFPTPTSDVINFESQDKIVNVELINLAGQRIFSQAFDTQTFSLNLRSFLTSSGMYIARIKLEHNQIITKKISLVD